MADDINEVLLRQAALLQGSTQPQRPQYGPSRLYEANTRGQRPVAGERGAADAAMTALNTLDVLDDPGVAVLRATGVTGRDTSVGTMTRRRVREETDQGRGRPGQAVQDQPNPFQQFGSALAEFGRTGTYETPFEDAGFGERFAGGIVGESVGAVLTGGASLVPGVAGSVGQLGLRRGARAAAGEAADVATDVARATDDVIEETKRAMPNADPDEVAQVAEDVARGNLVARDIERRATSNWLDFIGNPVESIESFRKKPSRTTAYRTPTGTRVTVGERRQKWIDTSLRRMTQEQRRKAAESINNGIRIEDSRRTFKIAERDVTVKHWYDLEPMRQIFKESLGEEQGEQAFNGVLSLFAATSPQTKVRPNALIAANLTHHISRGRSMEQIMAMTPEEFGKIGVGVGDALFMGSVKTVKPEDVANINKYLQQAEMGSNISPKLRNEMRKLAGDNFTVEDLRKLREGSYVPTRKVLDSGEVSVARGALGKLLTEGIIEGQKVGSFFRNLSGDFGPITVDIHNTRQTLEMLGYDLQSSAGRRKVLRDLQVNENTKFAKNFIKGVDDQGQPIKDHAEPLYAQQIRNNDLYGAFEGLQIKLKDQLIDEGLIPDMTNAEFQARLWVGSSASVPADTVTATEALADAIVAYGKSRGIEDFNDAVRSMWNDGKGLEDVVLGTAIDVNGLAEFGVDTPEKLRQLMMRNAVRASEGRDEEEESE